jgi:transcriptional regulator with XRE-family HTH domain
VDDRISVSHRRALGAFLRARRDRLRPAEAGLAAGQRRRTPGLRREELAQLCAISPTWYTWIEQGRDVSVSAAALGRLADALGLTSAERRYVFALAGKHDPRGGRIPGDAPVPTALRMTVDAISLPAYVLDRRWNVVAHNAAARHLFAGWLDTGEDRNLLAGFFLDPDVRALIPDWDERAERVVAEFRADCGPDLDEPRTDALVAELRRGSPAFAEAWDAQVVVEREGRARTFVHPDEGTLRYEQLALAVAHRPDLKLVVLAPLSFRLGQ